MTTTEPTAAYAGRVKYDDKQSGKYQHRKPHKHRAEMRLIDRAFARIPKNHRVLDIPCGGGRVMLHLAKKGYFASGADLSESMLTIARERAFEANLSCHVERQDLEKLTYADGHFDTLVCFRLFHHFPNVEIRQRVISELCRVAGQFVALSYFSPYSVQSVRRKLSGRATTGTQRHWPRWKTISHSGFSYGRLHPDARPAHAPSGRVSRRDEQSLDDRVVAKKPMAQVDWFRAALAFPARTS